MGSKHKDDTKISSIGIGLIKFLFFFLRYFFSFFCWITFLTDGANVEHLTSDFNVGVISTDHFPLAREIRLWQIVEVQILEKTIYMNT